MTNKKPKSADKKLTATKEPKPTQETTPSNEKKECCNNRTGDPIWPIFLISLGTMFLLNNFGIVPWSIWGDIWRLWPIFLVLAGLRIIIGKNIISNLIITLLGLLFFGSIIIYAAFTSSDKFNSWLEDESPSIHERFDDFRGWSNVNTEDKSITVKEEIYTDVKEREINIEIGARTLGVTDSDDMDYLKLESNFIKGKNEPTIEEQFEDGVLSLTVDNKQETSGWNMMNNPFMDIEIGNPTIPTSLRTVIGAGTANIELSKVVLSGLDVQLGAGTLNLNLEKDNVSKLESFIVEVGAGTLNIGLPEDSELGWKITYDLGLGTLNINGDDYHGDDTFTSENYQDSTIKIDVTVDAGVGTVNIDID